MKVNELVADELYRVIMVDYYEVLGVFIGVKNNFYLFKSKDRIIPIRESSIKSIKKNI